MIRGRRDVAPELARLVKKWRARPRTAAGDAILRRWVADLIHDAQRVLERGDAQEIARHVHATIRGEASTLSLAGEV